MWNYLPANTCIKAEWIQEQAERLCQIQMRFHYLCATINTIPPMASMLQAIKESDKLKLQTIFA